MRERLSRWHVRWDESFLGACWRRADDLDLGTAALALGAQEVLCTAPLLVALSAIMARFHLGYVGSFLDDVMGLDETSARAVRSLFNATRNPELSSLWLGLGAAILFYVSVAATTQRSVDAIWGREYSSLWMWWRRFAWVLGQIPMYAVALLISRLLHSWHVGSSETNIAYSIGLGIAAGLFHWWGHHLFLENSVTWRALAPSALAIGAGVFVLSVVSPFVMPAQISDNVADYGLIGAAFILSLWAVTYSGIVVYGTLVGQVYVERSRRRREVTSARRTTSG